MKTILIFIDWFTPGYKAGGPIQSIANLTNFLAGQYNFKVVTRDTDMGDTVPYLKVESNQWNTLSEHLSVFYFSSDNITRDNLSKILTEVKFDWIYINSIYSWSFATLPLWLAKKHKKPVIICPRGMLQQGALAVKPLKKMLFLRLFKLLKLHKDIRWHATDAQEERDIKRIFGANATIMLAENVPDTSLYLNHPIKKKPASLKIATISLITIKKNIHFLIELIKRINIPVTYDIYGPKKDADYWSQCQQLIERLPENIKVNYKGVVKPEEFHETISKYHFFVLPTLGENFGHAIFQALNSWRPIIISDKTPWRNLAVSSAGWDLPLDDKGKWENVLRKCYSMEQEEYDNLCNGAQQVAVKYMEQSDFINKYKQLFGDR